jgi:hypothetical protein
MEACQMRTNTAVTVWNRYIDSATRTERWQRTQIPAVAWENRKGSNVLASGGNITANQASIYIPMQGNTDYLNPMAWLLDKIGNWTLKVGDIIAKGLIDTELTPTFTVSDLENANYEVLTITSVDLMDAGSLRMRHWKVGAN